jgi:GT2 family glycosyltransferase
VSKPAYQAKRSGKGRLDVCIVSYLSAGDALSATVESLARASRLSAYPTRLILVDNSIAGRDTARLTRLLADWAAVELRQTGENIGYGRANNLGLLGSESEFLLVLNPDVRLREDSLAQALQYLSDHPECALLTPRAVDQSGHDLHLNHGYPSIAALAGRAITGLQHIPLIARSVARYELRDKPIDSVHHDTICASGCFMLFRAKSFQRESGFNPAFFLYFEDYDLSLRIRQQETISYVPRVTLEHLGGDAASKGFAHRQMFIVSAFRFFRRHGWRWA